MTIYYRLIVLFVAAQAVPLALAASSIDQVWSTVEETQIASRAERLIQPNKYRTVQFDALKFNQHLASSQGRVWLPMPEGQFVEFKLQNAPVMHPQLAKKYPNIRTWAGSAVDGSGAWARVDLTPAGFHGMVRSLAGTYFIDPYQTQRGQIVGNDYLVYYKADLSKGEDHKFHCLIQEQLENTQTSEIDGAFRTPVGSQLRTYRTAVAGNAEYTNFHGGTVESGLAAIVTAINRVTGIYETELAIRLELIANNDQLIFTNTATDGYSNNNGVSMLGQNQAKLDSVIGSGNYDIGHVFSTGGGGVAGLGVVCRSNNKARGVTGLGSPIGDPFYVDYVAHEMGHQFGGNHTFNGTAGSCAGGNRNGPTAYEPGSGSTIMAYAGICGSHNITGASDAYFHSASFGEITAYTTGGAGGSCPAVTATGNSPPIVDAGTPRAVPANTPLRLSGSAVDPDGHALIYRWEEYDLGPGGSPNAPLGNAPIFRSFNAVDVPVRLLPRLTNILNDSQSTGELIPSYERTLSFRLTALDNQPLGGGVDFDFVSHSVLDTGAAFAITSHNSTEIWPAFSQQTVTWDVAGTTDFPISCNAVDITLSTDSGQTFTHIVATSTANDGSEAVTVPNDPSNNGRIMVACSNNIFFDINNATLIFEAAPDPDFALTVTPATLQVCAPDEALATVSVTSINGFDENVTLSAIGEPPNTTVVFTPNPVVAGFDAGFSLGNTAGSTSGLYSLNISGNASTGDRETSLTLDLATAAANTPLLTTPSDQAVAVVLMPTFSWEPAANATSYLVELASDAEFTAIIESAVATATSYEVQALLEEDTIYFWRITAMNACGDAVSLVFAFNTVEGPTTYCTSPSVAIPDNDPVGVTDVLTISDAGTVVDVDVSLIINHGYIGNLRADLVNQNTGTTVEILNQPGSDFLTGGCPLADIDATLDDASDADAASACELTGVAMPGSWMPASPLSAFQGQDFQGDWTLVVYDDNGGATGTLMEWCLTIVAGPPLVTDTDGDGFADDADNCIDRSNANQVDADNDGYGNVCDPDLTNDGVINFLDLALFQPLFLSTDAVADMNVDGVVNFLDLVILTNSFLGIPGPSAFAP